jgi:hypothetical protein
MGGVSGNLKGLAQQEDEHATLERDLERQLVSFFLQKKTYQNESEGSFPKISLQFIECKSCITYSY